MAAVTEPIDAPILEFDPAPDAVIEPTVAVTPFDVPSPAEAVLAIEPPAPAPA